MLCSLSFPKLHAMNIQQENLFPLKQKSRNKKLFNFFKTISVLAVVPD